jgi:hypothetical protein
LGVVERADFHAQCVIEYQSNDANDKALPHEIVPKHLSMVWWAKLCAVVSDTTSTGQSCR